MKELKEKLIWLLWKFVFIDGKKTKVPISHKGEPCGTTSDYSSSWCNYETAKNAKDIIKAQGIGFVIPKGYFFLDIDHRDVDDELVKTMLDRFDTYAEYSQSGNGIHIYGKCDMSKLPIEDIIKKEKYFMKNSSIELELYVGGCTNRMACFTGNNVNDKELNDCTDAVIFTLDNEMLKKKDVNIADKILKVIKNQDDNQKAIDLIDGNFTSYFGSQSEAELALCCIIAKFTGNKPELVDKVFRKTKLYRDKWERDDYRNQTIDKAIKSCNGHFIHDKSLAPSFVKFSAKDKPYISVPLLADYIRTNLKYILVKNRAKQCTHIYLYDKVYTLYDEDMMVGVIKKIITDYDIELVDIPQIKNAITHIMTDLNFIHQDLLNNNESLIAFNNGLLNLDTMKLMPHTDKELLTILIPCDWTGKSSETPIFDKYISTLSNNDEAVKNLLLEYMGAVLSNVHGYRTKKFMLLVGEHDTGKSQIKALLEKLLGKNNYMSIDLSDLTQRFSSSSLYGKRLSGCSDMSFVTIQNTKVLKQITGGDSVMAEFKGENLFEFVYNGFLLMCANKAPKLGANQTDKATYERIILVKCDNVIQKDKQDKKLLEKMYEERDGIIYKAITAFKKVYDNDYEFTIPEKVIIDRNEYQKENNTTLSFIEECLTLVNNNDRLQKFTISGIYNAYINYCKQNNNGFCRTKKELKEEIAKYYGCDESELIIHTRLGNVLKNITLKENAIDEYC